MTTERDHVLHVGSPQGASLREPPEPIICWVESHASGGSGLRRFRWALALMLTLGSIAPLAGVAMTDLYARGYADVATATSIEAGASQR